jgi:prepilin-type processing-associated H-X9-DG protein
MFRVRELFCISPGSSAGFTAAFADGHAQFFRHGLLDEEAMRAAILCHGNKNLVHFW